MKKIWIAVAQNEAQGDQFVQVGEYRCLPRFIHIGNAEGALVGSENQTVLAHQAGRILRWFYIQIPDEGICVECMKHIYMKQRVILKKHFGMGVNK